MKTLMGGGELQYNHLYTNLRPKKVTDIFKQTAFQKQLNSNSCNRVLYEQ